MRLCLLSQIYHCTKFIFAEDFVPRGVKKGGRFNFTGKFIKMISSILELNAVAAIIIECMGLCFDNIWVNFVKLALNNVAAAHTPLLMKVSCLLSNYTVNCSLTFSTHNIVVVFKKVFSV